MNAALKQPVVSSEAQDRFGVSRAPAPPAMAVETLTLVERDPRNGTATFRAPNGDLIRAAMAPSDVTNQREQLDTYLGGYTPYGFCCDMCSPLVLVDKEKGDRRDLGKANAFEVVDTKLGRAGAINQIELLSELGSYHCQEYGLASFLPWQTENDAQQNFNVRASIGMLLQWKLQLHREVRVLDALTTLANWAATNRIDLSAQATLKWDNGNAKNPRADLQAILKASLVPPTGICMNPDVAFYFLADTEVRAYMKQMLGDGAPSPDVAAGAAAGELGVVTFRVPGLPPVHICPSKKLDGSGNAVYALADDVIILATPPSPPNDGLRMASHLSYRTRGRSGTGVQTNEYIPQGRGLNSGTMFELGFSEDPIQTSNVAGGLIKDVLS